MSPPRFATLLVRRFESGSAQAVVSPAASPSSLGMNDGATRWTGRSATATSSRPASPLGSEQTAHPVFPRRVSPGEFRRALTRFVARARLEGRRFSVCAGNRPGTEVARIAFACAPTDCSLPRGDPGELLRERAGGRRRRSPPLETTRLPQGGLLRASSRAEPSCYAWPGL